MTVAEIKERIDEREKTYIKFAKRKESLNPKLFVGELEVIKSMLDDLEPKAKWTNNMNGTFTCSRCGAKRPNDNYCGNCGAK